MKAWVSCSGSPTTVCVPHALGGAQCVEQRAPDLQHSMVEGETSSIANAGGGSTRVRFAQGRFEETSKKASN